MAVPKKRTPSSRRDSRRSHHSLDAPTVSRCPKCGTNNLPHTVCKKCGTYRGLQLVKGGK